MAGVDGHGRENRLELAAEIVFHRRALLLSEIGDLLDPDTLLLQRRKKLLAEAAVHRLQEFVRALANGIKLVGAA